MSLPPAPASDQSSPSGSPEARKRPVLMIALLSVLVLGGLGWTAAWFYASARATQEIDGWMAAEAAKGRVWACREREFGGFPFRFELICTEPTLTLSGPTSGTVRAARAHAVAQVWNPRHIIAEFDGPAVISTPSYAHEIEARWSLLQVSGVGRPNRLDRMSIAVRDYTLTTAGTTVFGARVAEWHMRHTPGADAATLDIAAGVKGATGVATGTAAPSSIDGELEATVTQVPDWQQAQAPMARLEAWRGAGGQVKLLEARLSGGGGALNATGTLGLDGQRRPEGALEVTVVNASALMGALSAAGLAPEFLVSLSPALAMVGAPATLDGAPASRFPFTFREGRVGLGLLPLGKIGPVY